MARFEISLTADYVKDWGVWEGIRELIQNARDGEIEHGAKMSVHHTGQTLMIKNEGAVLPREALLIGYSTKRSSNKTIGQFGEGLKLGTLALLRAGLSIRIQNGEEIWAPCIVRSEKYNASVLAFDVTKSRAQNPKQELTVKISGLSLETWETLTKNFLFLSDGEEKIETHAGDLLLSDRQKGKLYAKGILVEQSTYKHGYNYASAQLDRDRKMINGFDRKYYAGCILAEAIKKDKARKQQLFSVVDEMLRQNKDEVTFLENSLDSMTLADLRTHMMQRFKSEYGEKAVAVRNMSESRELEYLGMRGIVMSEAYVDILSPVFGNIDEIKQQAWIESIVQLSWSDLTAEEKEVFNETVKLIAQAYEEPEGEMLDSINIVEFPEGMDVEGIYRQGKCWIGRPSLTSVGAMAHTVVHELGHKMGFGDGSVEHAEHIGQMLARIINILGGYEKNVDKNFQEAAIA